MEPVVGGSLTAAGSGLKNWIIFLLSTVVHTSVLIRTHLKFIRMARLCIVRV